MVSAWSDLGKMLKGFSQRLYLTFSLIEAKSVSFFYGAVKYLRLPFGIYVRPSLINLRYTSSEF